jgi:hypothetical protein
MCIQDIFWRQNHRTDLWATYESKQKGEINEFPSLCLRTWMKGCYGLRKKGVRRENENQKLSLAKFEAFKWIFPSVIIYE